METLSALQAGDPGLSLFALNVLVTAGLLALVVYWVYTDARARGSSSAAWWAVASVFGPVFLAYLFVRWRFLGERDRPRTQRERIAGTLLAAALTAFLLGPLLSPPDPFTQLRTVGLLLAVTLPLAYLLVYRDGYSRLRARLA